MSVFESWAAVMGDVQAVRKTDRNTAQNYMFRGIDAVMNAAGPVLRKHGVAVVPTTVGVVADERYKTAKGTEMRNVTVNVTWRVYGPGGDAFDGQSLGEAADSGDKAVSKAHSVAYRTFLLQALCLPTDEPDPDLESHERKTVPAEDAGSPSGAEGDGAETSAQVGGDETINAATLKQLEQFAQEHDTTWDDVVHGELGEDVDPTAVNVEQAKALCSLLVERGRKLEEVAS